MKEIFTKLLPVTTMFYVCNIINTSIKIKKKK